MKIYKILPVILIFYLTGCSSSGIIIKDRSSWEANDPKPFKSHIPVRITIHHEGEIFEKGQNAAEFIKKVQVWGMGPDRSWSDIPYHFLIDPDGNIYEGRNVFTTGETATEYDPTGHLLLTCLGNFEEQEISEEQLNSLIKLTAYCCHKYQISPDSIAAHKDFANTLCPGKNLYKYLQNGYIQSEVKKLLENGAF